MLGYVCRLHWNVFAVAGSAGKHSHAVPKLVWVSRQVVDDVGGAFTHTPAQPRAMHLESALASPERGAPSRPHASPRCCAQLSTSWINPPHAPSLQQRSTSPRQRKTMHAPHSVSFPANAQ